MGAHRKLHRSLVILACAALAAASFIATRGDAADTVCSRVKIEIIQELTLERVAFDAKMVITNNVPDKDLTNLRVDVTIVDAAGNIKNDQFFVRTATLRNIAGVDGSGTVGASSTAEIHWLIIPSPGAGGSDPAGVPYFVGATLVYSVDGKQETVTVNPDRIIVRPEPQLVLDYFTPFQVLGDNPFTPEVEAPIPFPLAVRILNEGYGPANKLKIESAQPKIVENTQGLLVNFRLLGAAVNDSAVSPSLTVNIGTLPSMSIATASWDMISTLSGRFVEFNATFSHAADLGGELTSLIKATNAHYLVRRVKVNLPGRDARLDFLADTDKDPEQLPDAIFESEIPGNSGKIEDARSAVTVVSVAAQPPRPTPQSPEVQTRLQTGAAGWVYAKMADPSQGLLRLLDVVRADGVRLDPNNFWVQEGLDKDYKQTYTLNLLDYRTTTGTTGAYTLVFTQPDEDTTPPVTKLIFDGPSRGADPVSITPETRIVFLATDNDGGSGVAGMHRKLLGIDADFTAAYPMNITTAGPATLEYYSVDRAGNEEAVQTTSLFIDNAAPEITSFTATPSTITPHAPRGIAAGRSTVFGFTALDGTGTLDAVIDIAKGSAFEETMVVRSLKATITSGTATALAWDGKDGIGVSVPTGVYTARLRVSDGLDSSTVNHTAVSTLAVTVAEWFTGEPLDPNPAAAQQSPRVAGTTVVWQDQRNNNWDIYRKDTTGGSAVRVTTNTADQTRPAVSGDVIVWQDNRSGSWDIYGFDLESSQEFVIAAANNDQERPVVFGDWVAWQDNRNGAWDIYAFNLVTRQEQRITSHERDQMRPALFGRTLAWEDYRHGLGEIYTYDLDTGTETRYTVNIHNQTFPALSGSALAWTDQREGQRDIYYSLAPQTETRVTYGAGDHSQAVLLDGVIVYTDYEAGMNDPNLAFYHLQSGVGEKLTAHPARQEEPALGTGILVWQDDRDGLPQIYWSPFQVEALPIQAEIRPGFNLIAVGEKLAATSPTAGDLIAAGSSMGIEKVVVYDGPSSQFIEAPPMNDAPLRPGTAIGVYAASRGTLDVGDSGETRTYALAAGTNYVGMMAVPPGYRAYDLLASVGMDNIQSVRRFNAETGAWETAAVRTGAAGSEAAGVNFVVEPGAGLIITMKNAVSGWKP